MKVLSLVGHVALTLAVCAASPAVEPWFGAPIPASGEDGRADCGMTAARVFDAPIAGLERIGTLAVPKSADLPESSTGSIGFECLDRGLFDPDRCYDTLAAAGVKWARCQTMWSRCEKQKGVYDFTVLDGVVDNLTRRGIRPWFSVTFGNTLYMTNCFTGAAVGCVPTLYGEECRAAWCAYVRALARRYKGKVTHWEVWNEPNLPQFWQPSKPNADDYLALVKLTGSVIREEIPDAKIGGTTASPALNAWEKRFFEAGGAKAIDFWCGHAYTRVPERLRKQQRIASGSSDDYVTVLKDVRAFIDAHGGKHVEIWQGESGFPSWFPAGHWLWWPKSVCKEGWQSQANQAKWLLRRFVTDRRAGIARSSFFQMADISRHYSMATTTQKHPAEHGIVNGWTYRPKMSCHAFGHYNALLATARHDDSVAVSVTPASDAGAPTVATAFRAANGAPLFLYYTAFDFSGSYTGTCYTARCDAKLTVPAALAPKDPVLVDMLRGGVYAVALDGRAGARPSHWDNGHLARCNDQETFANLPLVDYPLVLADRSTVKLAPAGDMEKLLDGYVAAGRIAGVVSVLSDRDYHVQFDCVGWAERGKRKMTPDTLFAIFSMTKTFTGAALMCAIDDGKLSLDDEVAKFLPEFADVKMKDGSRPKCPLTLRHLTTHTTGWRGGTGVINRDIPLREVARQLAARPLSFQPGETFAYGNAWICTAAACLEKAVGKPYEVFLKERVLDPLGMKDTTFAPNAEQLTRLVCAYTSDDKPLRPAADRCVQQLVFPKAKPVFPAASGGLFSTPRDMIAFSQMLAHHGEWKGKTIISRKTFDSIFAVKQTPTGIPQPYTCGSWLYGDWFGHEGAMRTDQRANLRTGHSRVFFIQTENKAGSAFFQLKKDWHAAELTGVVT